ncbi:MAG TPA: glycosyltransferase family 2 protein [Acidiphilium sp.]|nr:MAG: glycosyltransferase [Acidiphilium sp. 21-60-14]OYV90660.1 MAG: glycosyltransferase [Acidiphilium sp. 37-60-79]OZB38546.1 MAG: glycosyltransferase [Acidiphilium sp. 34-60-192]HQT88159.1 glycosyltransferase family 2 protein [Acidiphilium sp.]HQU24221.1 glycosyltransferase family 2 protein [Acidiphilium sp.]
MISIVVPFHNEAANITPLYERLSAVLAGEDWELVCVNDGSRDDTLARLITLSAQDPRVRVLDLARNFGKEAALTAGLDHAQGDAVIPLDADLQDPPELIPAMIAKWRDGFDVVNAVRASRDSDGWLKRTTARSFYRVINRLSDVPIPSDTGDFRLIARPVLEALNGLRERRRFMKGLFAWVGFRTIDIPYHRAPRHGGKTSWNYWKLWNFALEGITSFSSAPLRLASYLGVTVSIFAFIYAAIIIFRKIMFGNAVAGYPSLIVVILFLGGVQLLALGVIGEYLGRIYEESKQRPIYLIRARWESSDRARPPRDRGNPGA